MMLLKKMRLGFIPVQKYQKYQSKRKKCGQSYARKNMSLATVLNVQNEFSWFAKNVYSTYKNLYLLTVNCFAVFQCQRIRSVKLDRNQTSTTSISPSAGFSALGAGGTGPDFFWNISCRWAHFSGAGI